MAARVLLRLALLLAALLTVPPAWADDERYHGRVVDVDAKQPLEGAAVTVMWMKYPVIILDGVSDFHGAREALTDAEGRFSIDATPPFKWNPFRSLTKRPEIIVYKPGYAPYPGMYTLDRPDLPPIQSIAEPLYARRPVTIGLPKLATERELRLFTSPSLHPRVPYERVPIYMRLIDEQRIRLNLEPLVTPDVRSHKREGK